MGFHRTALLAFGSETGNASNYAEELSQSLQRIHFQTRVATLDAIEVVRISGTDKLVSKIKDRTDLVESIYHRRHRHIDYRSG